MLEFFLVDSVGAGMRIARWVLTSGLSESCPNVASAVIEHAIHGVGDSPDTVNAMVPITTATIPAAISIPLFLG